ncbi:hypothetical protein [Lysinibacillus sphaericus]|uniref:hypothetical protein n=1 Tax=Lysinibacillus sphaericus TaxID=1421 RepID=UPI0018CE228E|nr:hypothetical protein [Lysinibacillus sphaericus]MBG9479400.1 hypothetical protein [Lysinibacillus sphaericus]MBG9479451.1 hypothetical protein [Lysinibacillus sphaericus]
MGIEAQKVHVNSVTNKASIDATNGKVIYIVDNGEVEAIPLPPFGTLEIACQNYKIHNLQYRQTIKRK